MRLRQLRLPALLIGVLMLDATLDAPRPATAAACAPGDCLTNSAVNNRVQPTSVNADDKGDVTFFASQSGQLPNVVFVLDNSTSMYELPYDLAAYPNSAWTSKGQTPNGCGTVTTTAPSGSGCTGTTFAQTATSCGNNTYFAGLKDSGNLSYSKSKTYAAPDPWYDGTHGTSAFFTNNSAYKFFEWAVSPPAAGGTANGGPITFTPAVTVGPGTVSGAINNYCNGLSSTAASGGKGGTGVNAWTMTQRQRCQQCIDEVGYYIAPGAGVNESNSNNVVFKGNWLNFFPPKYLVARKVLTDFITRQSTTPTPVRIGVVTYDPQNVNSINVPGTGTGFSGRNDGGAFVSSGMIPDCSVVTWTGSTTATQQTNLITSVRGISWGSTSNPIATPLAEAVFNVGQFFTGGDALWKTAFTSGSSNIWLKSGFTAPTGANKPLCVACQVNAIVLITDGEPYGDNNLPQKFRDNKIQCPRTPSTAPDPCGTDQGNSTPNLLDDVTNYLATTDLAIDDVTKPETIGIQDVITFVIGMGLKVPLLDNAAKYGKTTAAMRADNSQDLQDEVTSAVVNIVARATAFSSTAIQTLEVGTGSTAYVPRFIPGSPTDALWEGHLFRFDLFNEFVAGVDLDKNGNLDGVFLVDKDGDIVTEDDKGAFHKQKNNAPAVPVWDAGVQLGAMPAANRKVYTALWDSTNSKWKTIAWPTWDGTGSPPADFASVRDLLGIDGTNPDVCAQIKSSMATPIPAAYLSSTSTFDRDHCAKAIIDYVRGYNILNELTTSTSVTANRARMLGDIFHSSPVVVDPPVDQFICNLGLHAQCVSTLYQYDTNQPVARPDGTTPSDQYTVGTTTVTAYEKYWQDHETRQRVVLVGANDGMIHAFDAGSPTASPPVLNPNVGFRQVVYDSGTGNELWGFIPPDQLSRLWLMMRDGHQMYIDGDIMVRDVWVDGVKNDKGTTSFVNKPLVKQDVEYHTVAVVSERQGGSHFFALDVTDPTTPSMLWVYPLPCSDEEAMFGQTWGQFSPRPPPIGAVMLQTSDTAGRANYGFDHTEERYAVFLNGGHSPYMNRGRLAALLDVYSGAPLFLAKYDTASTASQQSKAMRFGFPATGALVDYGTGNSFTPDGFFDTGVMSDEGGQIWAFRFGVPGHIDSTTQRVDNWTFGRAYEPNTSASDDSRYHQPIYTIAATTVQEDTGWLRAFVGSGDRAHVRSQNGGDCRPDDPMSCISAGCRVTTSLTLNNGTGKYASDFGSTSTTSASSPTLTSPTQTISITTNACNQATVSETVTVAGCPDSTMSFTDSLSFSCTGSPLACTEVGFPQPTPNRNRNYTTTTPVGLNMFVSVPVLADTAKSRRMTKTDGTTDDGKAYDTNRYTASELVDVSNTTADSTGKVTSVTAPAASSSGPGWLIKYPTIDEKTVTSSTILGGCVLWNTLLPSGGTVGCASAGANTATAYQADPFTGAPTCASSFIAGNNFQRKTTRSVLSPPPEPAAAVALGAGGSSLRLSMLEIQPGAQEVSQTTVGTSTELLQMIYTLPLTYDQHVCRHVDPLKCN